ncbi:lipid-A-disaccharide synthase-related protein [Candidatus Aerophobetes bacterium]|nr:lipid-A-disaccharide synthase-related protein [Candidatus Aerophobetes bacterium]
MAKSESILFLSNGHAEDIIACSIIDALLKEFPFLKIKVLPFVGDGYPYRRLNIEILGPCRIMPSDGFIAGNFFYFLRDLRAGWLKMYREKIRNLKEEKDGVKMVVCVGDIFLVLTSAFFIKKPLVFIATAKSDYIREHYLIEKWIMRKFCRVVIARDKKTASSLKDYGINATYLGNPMMDCLEVTGEVFGIKKDVPVVGIVPGSRKEAYHKLITILCAVREIYLRKRGKISFLLALSPSLNAGKIVNFLKNEWVMGNPGYKERERGVVAYLISPEGALVKVTQGKFGDVVNLSRVIIGTAGMANEQAVGLGKPVVAFPGKGPQITEKFLQNQRKLLGGCVFIVKNDAKAIASRVLSLLDDSNKLCEIAKIGRERMGAPGASLKIARLIYEESIRVN